MENKEYQFDDEIDLMDYIKVILKRKKLILFVFWGFIIVLGVVSFLMPKVYRIDNILIVGKMGDSLLIEPPVELVERINSDVYKPLIKKNLKIDEKDYPKIKAENPSGTSFIKLTIDSSNIELAKNILNEINNIILEEHKEKFLKEKKRINQSIKEIENKLRFIEVQKQGSEGIAELQMNLYALNERLENFEETKIIKSPTVSEKPIKPNVLLNIIIAGVLGLFIGIFLAFFLEWWEKGKESLKELDK